MKKIFFKQFSFYNHKKVNDFNFFKFFVASWFVLFVFLGMAFSGFTTSMAAEGMATFQAHIYDFVYITGVRISGNSNASSVNYSFLDHELNATVMAPTCDGYVEYKIDIVNTTPYKAFITAQGITSQINGSGNPTTTLSAEFTDVTLNSTYINPHSTKTVTMRIKNNCSGSDDQVTIKPNFEYSLYKYFDLTVNSVPNDATVSITTQEGTFTGTGSVTHRVYEGETATFKANKKYYYEGTGSYTMGTNDHTETLTLVPDPHRDLTITPTPDSATVVVKQNNEVICSGTGELVCSVVSGENVTYTVDNPEYYYTENNGVYSGYEETFLMPTTETTKSVTLQERPWITGTTSNSSNTSAKTYSGRNWHAGYYLVEVWGGAGGAGDQTKGASGYVYGVVYIPYESYAILSAGGNGSSETSQPSGGANGGGTGGTSGSGSGGSKGGGGGYSSVIVSSNSNNNTVSTTTISSGEVKFIAGGGGGASARGGTFGTSSGGNGGSGGNLSNTVNSITAGKVFSGSNGTSSSSGTRGGGGSTSAGSAGTSAAAGSFLTGGSGYERGGGGGAGYYGGGGGGISSVFATAPGGGGGGSSFLASDVTYTGLSSTITSKLRGTNPSSTGGAVIVTWIGKTM